MKSMMRSEETDVVIIGAGPAGSVAASKLLKEGVKVIVLEKTEFPRFVIGESLLPQCMEFLDDIGVLDRVEAHKFQYKSGALFFDGEDRVCEFLFSQKYTKGWEYTYQVKRSEFDKILSDFAEEKGADIRFKTAVTNFELKDGKPNVEYENSNGEKGTITSNFVIDASGYGRVLPRLLDLTVPTDSKPRGAVYSHFEDRNKSGQAADNIYIHAFNNNTAWVWSIPFSDETSSVGVVGDVDFIKECYENDGEKFLEIVQKFPNIKGRYSESKMLEPLRATYNYSTSVSSLFGDGFVLCGNATEFLDPIFSSGVTLAIASGFKAAVLAKKELSGESVDWQTDYEDYLMYGVDVFKSYVNCWYDGSMHTIFFEEKVNIGIKEQICSVLAGYVWDKTNPFVKNHNRLLKSLVATIRIQSGQN
jgi:flavin-dependent dehydrogenase